MLGLLLHLLHQPGALDDVREARIILDIGGDGELTAGLDALHHDRREARARGIDRRRKAGGAGAEDDQFGVAAAIYASLSLQTGRTRGKGKAIDPASRARGEAI